VVGHVYNPRYTGGIGQRITDQGQKLGKTVRPYLKNKNKKGLGCCSSGKCLSSEHVALSSNPSYHQKKKKKKYYKAMGNSHFVSGTNIVSNK
jgi:hypothetical protein